MADDPQDPSATDDPKPDDTPDLGDAGKKALQAERDARKAAEKQAKDLADRLKTIEDKDKSEVERLTEQVSTLTKERDEATVRADRLEVAVSKALDDTTAKRVINGSKRIVGSSRDELEADADDYFGAFSAPDDESDEDPTRRPKERLKPGATPSSGPEPDMREVVKSIPRGV